MAGKCSSQTPRSLPQGVTIRDLGRHRLKDIQQPEPIFQLVIPALPAAFPPLKTLDARPNNLPVQVTPFIGREWEVHAIRERLLNPHVRLVPLTGPGETGKTLSWLPTSPEPVLNWM